MTCIEFAKYLKQLAILQAMKPDEQIVCTNATVVMDSKGNLSYFNNDSVVSIITTGEKE